MNLRTKLGMSYVNSAKVIQVIQVNTIKGTGTENDPVRVLLEYWSLDGELLADKDTWTPEGKTEQE